MDLGKPLKVVTVPREQPARQPLERPATREDEGLIPLPADWPKRRSPARVPEKVAEWQAK